MRLLDVNVCIDVLRGRTDVVDRLHDHGPAGLFLCAIVKAELAYGARLSADPRRALELTTAFCEPFVSLPFDDACVDVYASIRSDLRAAGGMIGANDLIVAATAVAHHLTLVTGDTTEFARVPGLRVETWRT